MKKFCCLTLLLFLLTTPVLAHPHYYRGYHGGSNVYLIKRDYDEVQTSFSNCAHFKLLSKTTRDYYSNGARNTYTFYTILNSDGSVFESNILDVKHVIHNNEHYFIINRGKGYVILNEKGEQLSKKTYSKITQITPNRLLVRYEKLFGIIDLNENIIVPIKYKKMEQISQKIFLTKLNGYFGMLNLENELLIKNEYEKIERLYDTFILKKYGKYGLCDTNGKIILDAKYDKIKKLGEYILIKQDGKYGVFYSNGVKITDICYKKIELKRNTLQGKDTHGKWVEIQSQSVL